MSNSTRFSTNSDVILIYSREREEKTHRGGRPSPPTSVGEKPSPLHLFWLLLLLIRVGALTGVESQGSQCFQVINPEVF